MTQDSVNISDSFCLQYSDRRKELEQWPLNECCLACFLYGNFCCFGILKVEFD
jgi:hypothetical protein